MYEASIVFSLTVPLESLMMPANLNDSSEFYELPRKFDPELVKRPILAFV
ncbi:hypothetical protein [Ferroplasma sp.]|nr:hypothetical protein [Ferroplasma sp.]